jgi:hypothetical protein
MDGDGGLTDAAGALAERVPVLADPDDVRL